ncbi:NADH:ubiquinone reductase (Na(+)-transporting) subunit F [Oleiharenicola lentus]|uniref:NADH:ubiquinone reductase (Na(+)-transporting) subunit F n=1 Tax=Oleiharenicola lentus TaxID=2508720 RepID=UPI003F676B68
MSHDHATPVLSKPPAKLDYSLTGVSAVAAVEKGLAEADWYQCHVPRATMRRLLERRDGPAIRDTLIWFALLGASGYAGFLLWGSWWAIIPFAIYGVLYASVSDSRWHEGGHGTAFKTDWMNNFLYEIASFMVMRESTVWRWSHTRHHSDTIIVGRDPEIAVPRPPDVKGILMAFFSLKTYPGYFRQIVLHSFGRTSADEKTYIPETEFPKIYFKARLYVLIYASVIAAALITRSVLPLMYVGLTNLYGSWLMIVYGLTQHAGLAENVLDHRLNCRTVYMNFVHRYLYWNMNYHVEHHMFPLVPYHALPQLHEAVKADMPTPYPGILAAYREIIPTVLRQVKDPAYHVKRQLPARQTHTREATRSAEAQADRDGWIEVCAAADLGREEVIRFDQGRKTYALFRDADDLLHATDGICTHGNTHLADGLVKGKIVECPKHNGRFNLTDGSPARAPVCRGLSTYPLKEAGGRLYLNPTQAGGAGARAQKTYQLRVVSNRSVATFIKELVLEPVDAHQKIAFTPGDYLQIDIPAYEKIAFADFDTPEPYAAVWRAQRVFDLVARNPAGEPRRNNYSLASNLANERTLRFNVRIATPPPGQECAPGIGSSYVYSLKTGDVVTAIGPFGDFHIKPTQKEMLYLGGGAGMAPLRAHLSQLLETNNSHRKISFWYGARSRQEIFYDDYFATLAQAHPNFSFHPALSSPLPEDAWSGPTGFIHEVALEHYLRAHPNPKAVEYYLCGPPMMIRACTKMLTELGIAPTQIAYDEF